MEHRELTAQIDGRPDLWDANRARKDSTFSPFASAQDIWVRYNRLDRLGPAFNDEHVPIWYPAWRALPALRPLVFGLMAMVQGQMLGGVLITRIPPGGGIAPHVDTGWHVDYYDKFYLSLRSAPGADFCFEDCSLNPAPGEIWRIDNRRMHWVTNASAVDRMTLIVCIRTDLFGRE